MGAQLSQLTVLDLQNSCSSGLFLYIQIDSPGVLGNCLQAQCVQSLYVAFISQFLA